MHSGWDSGWSHMIFGPFGMILFWGGIVLLIVLAVRWAGGSTRKKKALEILEERLARGEISREEFEDLRRRISNET